jgi:phosphatidylinositol alpha-mannosyltransferase
VGEPLRIAMVSYYLPSGSKIGVGYQVHELANALVDRGHSVDVVSACEPSDGARYRTRTIPLSGSLRTFRFATALRRLDLSGYDVLHAHGDDYWLWRRRVPAHVRTLHGSCFDEALRIRGAKERLRMVMLGLSEVLASLVADRTVVVSPETRRWTPWVADVIPNGVDLSRFQPRPTQRSAHPSVLFVGTYGGRKRGRDLVEAFGRDVLPRLPEAELWMVSGDAPTGLPGVRALGRVDDATLTRLYQEAWVFCLPSSYEGFGIPYAEAMASGLPVVATPNVGARYITREGADGVLVELEDLGTAVADLLEDAGRRRALTEAGLRRVRDFSLEGVVDRYEAVYRSLRDRRRALHPVS